MKKLWADTLHWDASYKEPKHLCQHRGNALFKGLMTGVNQIGEVRLQFHVVTDSKDQVVRPLDDFLGTVEAYGQPKPRLFWTDNVVADGDFFTDKLGLPTIEEGVEEEESVLPIAVVGDGECKYSNQTREINTNVEAMHCSLGPEGRVLSVDAEWAVRTDARGQVNGAGRVAVIQFAYILPGGEQTMALVVQLVDKEKLPTSLVSLFADPTLLFVGRCVQGDISRIGRDFKCTGLMSKVKTIDLGKLARTRDVVQNGTVSLQKLCGVVLGLQLPKLASVRLSRWSARTLSDEQVKYAALDAIVGLRIYQKLLPMPDLTARITSEAATPGVGVDIVPSTGKMGVLATFAGTGKVVEAREWETPAGYFPLKITISGKRRLVEVHTVAAPLLRVPGLTLRTRDGTPVTLRDLAALAKERGEETFRVVLPIQMLAPSVPGRVRPTPVHGGGGGSSNVKLGAGGGAAPKP